MIYQISDKALKQLQKLQPADKKKFEKVVQHIEKAETMRDIHGTEKIKQHKNAYRIKTPPYRILWEPLFTPFGKIEVPSAHDVRLIFGNFSCKNG